MSDSFDTSRNQWFSVLESHFHHGPVSQYRVGTNEVWGPATPGSKYTDYYYYSSTDSFYSYTWEPDGTMHLDQVASSTLRNDGLSFTYLEWQSNSDEKAAYWGKCYWLDREKNGRWMTYWVPDAEWPAPQEEQYSSSSDDCCLCAVM